MSLERIVQFSAGVNQSGVRDFNERLLLSMIQRLGPMPGSDLARHAGLSAQTVSVILRSLEADGLLIKEEPQRGKVGKPRVPMALNEAGAFSIGLKLGRRSADLALMDIAGRVHALRHLQYRFPEPADVFGFLEAGLRDLVGALPQDLQSRVSGIGVATPFELWKPHDHIDTPASRFAVWAGVDFAQEVARFSDLPIFVINDATSACYAENTFGRGRDFRNYAYFFVGSFIGGGVVLDDAVFEGHRGNAGAMGALIVGSGPKRSVQLMDRASLFLLESAIADAGGDPRELWINGADWQNFEAQLEPWIDMAAKELAKAAVSCCAVIDFEAVLIDGAFPADVRGRLLHRVRHYADQIETIGILRPQFEQGSVGADARVIGAAYRPIAAQFFLGSGGFGG